MRHHYVLSAVAGIVASILVGIGEYLLHFDELARFSAGGYEFMSDIPVQRSTIGHFLGVFGATLYPIGCYHIYLMLRPANQRWAFSAFLIGSFGFVVGAVWIGSRASVATLSQLPESPEAMQLIELYVLRYETLLHVIRLTTLVLSIILVWLSLTGRSHYPKWVALFNPIGLIIANFVIFAIAPSIGKHTMPIALNVAFFVFFVVSVPFAYKAQNTTV